jgi:hypothetical protein
MNEQQEKEVVIKEHELSAWQQRRRHAKVRVKQLETQIKGEETELIRLEKAFEKILSKKRKKIKSLKAKLADFAIFADDSKTAEQLEIMRA